MSVSPLLTFSHWLRRWFLIGAILCIFLMLCRTTALFYYGNALSLLRENPRDLAAAFFTGFRFDFVAICYGWVLPLLSYLLWIFFPFRWSAWLLSFLERIYFVFWVYLFVGISLVDLGYYSYFQDHINALIHGFFEDDTMALIRTFQKNYPFYTILSLSLVFAFGLGFFSTRIFRPSNYPQPSRLFDWRVVLLYVFLIPLVGVGARGSFGLFPLHEIDAAVSPDPFVNYLAYSGIHGLHRSIKVRGENNNVWNANGQYYGYHNWKEAAADLFDRPVDSLPDDPLDLIRHRTARNPWAEKTRPHVVMILMEGWGGYWMKYNSPQFNILGELETHFRSDNVLMNFLPSMTATIGSLSALMVNSPHRPEGHFLTESRYMQVPFRFSPAFRYKNAGYKTRFIYGGGIGWRTVDRFAKIQGFDTIEGDFAIEKRFGKIEKHDWGIYDEDVFRYIEETLKEATEPQFVFVMTTTNHPPYQVPSNYQPLPLVIPPELAQLLTSDAKLSHDRFQVYQYSNQKLGELITRLKSSPLGNRVLLAASGDHGFLLRNFSDAELLQKWQTPFYLYMPRDIYKKMDPQTFGSHIDIFPTLFELSLSNQLHFSFGVNLFDPKVPHQAYHFSRLAIDPHGAVLAYQQPQFFEWKEKYQFLAPTQEPSAGLQNLNKRYRALMGLMDYFYEFELENAKGLAPAGP